MKELGQYIVTKVIGEGGMGKVWRAWKISEGGFKKVLAIKTSKSSRKHHDLFMNEAKISARFDHENIVKTFDFGKTDNEFFIVMEYIRGVDLKELVSTVKKIPEDIFFYIIDKVLSAVIYIHNFEGRQLVHRDINSKNILVSWNGNIKLSDFGITLPQYGDFDPFGKIGYVPPEVILGKGWTQSGDIWCIGVLMWEILTSKKLFSGKNKEDIKRKIISGNITPPSQINDSINEKIDQIVLKALSRIPESRYISASELQEDIRKTMNELNIKPMYREDFSSFISEYFLDKIKEEEKELSEEETRITVYFSEKSRESKSTVQDVSINTKATPKHEINNYENERYYKYLNTKNKKDIMNIYEQKQNAKSKPSESGIIGSENLTKNISKNTRIRNKKVNRKKIFIVSSVLGFVFGLSTGIFKGSYDMQNAEKIFRMGVILTKEKNFHQAKKLFEISADISGLQEVKYIAESIGKGTERIE